MSLLQIKLRYPEQGDAEWMLAQEMSDDATAYSDFDADFSLKDVQNFIDLNRTGADPTQARLLIECEGMQAGTIDLTGISKRNGHADIGLLVSKDFRGKGVATEALRQAIQIASMMGVSHIKALISGKNPASSRVFEKVGFSKVGVLPGWLDNGKTDAAIYYLNILGDDFEEAFGREAAASAMDDMSLYSHDKDYEFDDPYMSDFDEPDEDFGFESLDDYQDIL